MKITKSVKLFISMAVASATVLLMMITLIIISHATADKTEMQTWIMDSVPTVGIFLLITMIATILTAIPVIYQQLTKLLKK